MTLFEFMPALWAILSFLFFAVYFLTDMRLFLLGCGGALFALCPALLGGGIFLQTDSAFRDAIALTAIDRRGGYILYKGRVRRAYPRDILYEYRLGDVLAVTELSNGTLCAYRI